MRFVDAGSPFDLKRARSIEFPEKQYGHGLFPYRPFTRQHMEIAEPARRTATFWLSACTLTIAIVGRCGASWGAEAHHLLTSNDNSAELEE